MGFHETKTSVKSFQKSRVKNLEQPGVVSKGPVKAFQINHGRKYSQLGSGLSKKSGSRSLWNRSYSLGVKLRRKASTAKKRVIARQGTQKRQGSSLNPVKKSKTTLPRRSYRLIKPLPKTFKNRFMAFRGFMDVHNKVKVSRKFSEIKDPKQRRSFLDYVAIMRFEKKDMVRKYQFEKHKDKVSTFVNKLKLKSAIYKNPDEPNSQSLESINNSSSPEGPSKVRKSRQENKFLGIPQQKQPVMKEIVQTMTSGPSTQKRTQIRLSRQKNCSSTPMTPQLLNKIVPVLEEASSLSTSSKESSRTSSSNISSSPDPELLHTPESKKPQENSHQTFSFRKNLQKGSPYHNRKRSLRQIGSPAKSVNFQSKETNLKSMRRPITSRPTPLVRPQPFSRRRVCLVQGEDKEKLESLVINFWGKMMKRKQDLRDVDMDSPTFARVKAKVLFSRNRNRVKQENKTSLEGSEKSEEVIFGVKQDLQVKMLDKEPSLNTEEAEDNDDIDGVGRMKKQLQGRDMNFLKRRRTKRRGYFFSKADQEAEIKKTISAARFLSRIRGKGSRRK